jgi:solute carrier family 25 carnitine/acylcarnitine transporter 20/29
MCLGIISGMSAKCTNYPLLNWKNTTQQGLPLSINPKIVYRGLPAALCNIGATTGVQFLLTGRFQDLIAGGRTMTDTERGVAAALGGAVSGVPCSLWELTMIQQQRFGGSLVSTPVRILKDHGVMQFSRGMMMCMIRESGFCVTMLAATPIIQEKIRVNYAETFGNDTALAIGSLASAFVGATATHPVDTIKTCMQGDLDRTKWTNAVRTGSILLAERGVAQGLFSGLSWRMALIATTFFLINKFKQDIAPKIFPKDDKNHH